MFGGKSTKEMKEKLKIPEKRPMADFLPTVTIAAKNFATELSNFKIKKDNLNGETKISNEHVKNNKSVRKVLLDDNIIPEELPAEEDIKKLERRVKKNKKEIGKLEKNKVKLK